MRIGLDTNVLVHAHIPAMAEHSAVRAALEARLGDKDTTLVVTPGVLHELIHIITDGRRFQPPVPMEEAVATAQIYLSASNVDCVPTDAEATALALDLAVTHRLGRKRLADTLFAATLLTHGVSHLMTCNPSDFAVFDGLVLLDPQGAP